MSDSVDVLSGIEHYSCSTGPGMETAEREPVAETWPNITLSLAKLETFSDSVA